MPLRVAKRHGDSISRRPVDFSSRPPKLCLNLGGVMSVILRAVNWILAAILFLAAVAVLFATGVVYFIWSVLDDLKNGKDRNERARDHF